jgi:hypothetical protein
MPEGCMVRKRAEPDSVFIVYRCYNKACLLWPAKLVAFNVWEEDSSVTELTWECIFDLDLWEEVPSMWISPLHAFLED